MKFADLVPLSLNIVNQPLFHVVIMSYLVSTLKYRSRIDIIAYILKSAAAEYGVGITKIMYDSYISYSQVREYMPYLVKNGFLEFYEDNRKYKITNKGKQLIKLYDGVEELLDATQINK